MSHLKERKERNCLNCNAQLHGKFCHICGQENIEPRESAWHLVTHFFQDITHFDGKFFNTLKWLLLRPGYLSAQYVAGRRASYLNPVRMYVFTSAFFFLIFFTVFKLSENTFSKNIKFGKSAKSELNKSDSAHETAVLDSVKADLQKKGIALPVDELKKNMDSISKIKDEGFHLSPYRTRAQYDSLLASGAVKDGMLIRMWNYKLLDINKKYQGKGNDLSTQILNKLIHSLPQMLFISLPLLALLLKMLYARRKHYYYVDHAIFSIHLYIFVFIDLLFIFAIEKINSNLHWNGLTTLMFFLYLGIFFYQYKAMRFFYRQGRMKTILKFLLLNFMFLFIMILLFMIFTVFSFFNI